MPSPVIIVNTSPTCQPCRATKRQLTAAGLPYSEIDLTLPEHADKLAALKKSTGRNPLPMPVVEVDGLVAWTEFRPDLISALAKEAAE